MCALVKRSLSVIKNPKPSRGQQYGKWLGGEKKPSFSDIIRQKIDEIVPGCAEFEEVVAALRAAEFSVKEKRKIISVCAPGQKRPTRLNTLGDDYAESAIRARLGTAKTISGGSDSGTLTRVGLLIDIQDKIREGKGAGYAQWVKIFNLKEAAKTLIFLQENGIDSYEDLKKKSSSSSGEFSALTGRVKEIEARQKEVSELQKYIGQYGKTREVYTKYKASGWSRAFYDAHSSDIMLHRAAKKYFDRLGLKKLPSINKLLQECGELASEKKKLYSGYHELMTNSRALAIAKGNAERLLGISPEPSKRDISHE